MECNGIHKFPERLSCPFLYCYAIVIKKIMAVMPSEFKAFPLLTLCEEAAYVRFVRYL